MKKKEKKTKQIITGENKEKINTNKIEKEKTDGNPKEKRKKNSISKTKQTATEIHSCISWYKSRW